MCTLRADVDPNEAMRVVNGIWWLPAGAKWCESVGRMLHRVIDGLRYGALDRAQSRREKAAGGWIASGVRAIRPRPVQVR